MLHFSIFVVVLLSTFLCGIINRPPNLLKEICETPWPYHLITLVGGLRHLMVFKHLSSNLGVIMSEGCFISPITFWDSLTHITYDEAIKHHHQFPRKVLLSLMSQAWPVLTLSIKYVELFHHKHDICLHFIISFRWRILYFLNILQLFSWKSSNNSRDL